MSQSLLRHDSLGGSTNTMFAPGNIEAGGGGVSGGVAGDGAGEPADDDSFFMA